jgi:predicted Zn finger-like uncharacterized protein
MAVEALCPTCGAVFSLKDEYVGRKVRCKKCEHVFTVAGEKVKERAEDGAVQAGAAAPPKRSSRDEDDDERTTRKSPARRGREDDEDDDRPRKRASRGRDDDDDDDDRAGGKKRRVYHDDDDDEPRRPRRKAPSGGGGAGKVIAIVAAIVVVVLLVCGGGIYGIYRWTERTVNDLAADQQFADQFQQAMNEAAKQDPNFPFDRQPKDLDEALTFLRGNVASDRRGAARWLARQPLDNGRRKEVATALDPLLKEDDGSCAAAASALKVWGTKDNGPALTAALKQKPDKGIPGDTQKELMAAIGRVKYEPGADEIIRFMNNHFVCDDAQRALADLGPGAEKTVLKSMHHKEERVRSRARRLLDGYQTKPGAPLDQTIEDLGSVEQERNKNAAEWLAQPASNPALELAKAEPARRTAVAKGLNRLIENPPTFFEDTLLNAVKRWGTKDNVPSLIHMLTNNPFKKREAADALIAIGPACEPDVKALLSHRDQGVVEQAKRVLTNIGSADVKYIAAIEDLKSDDFGRTQRASRTLQAGPADEKQRPAVVAGLMWAIKDTGVRRSDSWLEDIAKALVVWATKDDGPQIVEKLKEMDKAHCKRSRKVLIEWLGKQKVEQAIPLLASMLVERDYYEDASRALQAMGPELGSKIEKEVASQQTNDRNMLVECLKVLGAVGTKDSLPLVKQQQVAALKKKDDVVAAACKAAIDAINAR